MKQLGLNHHFYFGLGLILVFISAVLAATPIGHSVAISNTVVISQVYGGGGNTGAPYTHDFVELFNRGNESVDLANWQVKIASSTGAFGSGIILTGTIPSGGYFLIQLTGGSNGQALPTADQQAGSLNLSATSGKVVLIDQNNATIDLVGYGSATTSFEGSGPSGNLDNTKAAIRLSNGCTDTDNNNADFQAATPNPRNSHASAQPCFATATPSPTASAIPTAINTVTPTPSSSATPSLTPSPSATPTSIATNTSVPISPTPTTTPVVLNTSTTTHTSTPMSPTPTTTPAVINTSTATQTPSPTSTATRVPARNILINEIDADTPGSDAAEFVELFDGGGGDTSLDGLVLVFYDGLTHKSYYAVSLNSQRTESDGYFVLGNSAISAAAIRFNNNILQNGPDAVALYVGTIADFPNGTPITTTNLLDAVVYGTDDEDDAGLLTLLNPSQPQVNESAGGSSSTQSIQRCANGSGGQRNTDTFSPNSPNPGAANICPTPTPTSAPTEAPTKAPTATKVATVTKTPAPTETAILLVVPSDTPSPTPDPAQRTQELTPNDEILRRLIHHYYLMEIHAEDGE